MKAAGIDDIEARLLEIDVKITDLNVKNDFKKIIQEDLDLAKSYLKSRNILGVINCLLVIVGKLHTHVIAALCPCIAVEPLLICIHRLLQALIKLPVNIVGPTGATGPIGPMGPPGTTHIISSCTIPACDYPVECKEPVKTQCFDNTVHYQFICKPQNPFRK